MARTVQFAGCFLLALTSCVTTSQLPARFNPNDVQSADFFPILPWDPLHGWGAPTERGSNGLESIAACNFNLAGFVLPRDLPFCRKLGLGAIMMPVDPARTNVQYIYQWKNISEAEIERRVKTTVQACGSDPAVAGYFLTDEPGASSFPALARAVAAVRKYAPGKLAYINLFPDYASTLGAPLSQLETSNYNDYLERFVAEVHPQMISYDNYMVEYSGDLKNPSLAADYFRNMLAVRRVALEHQLPYLNIVGSSQIRPSDPPPSPANLLLQAYTTLAAGFRGVTWYTYFGSYPYTPISAAGGKTPTWAWLREVNGQVAALAPVMSRLTSTGVFFTAPPPASDLPVLPGELIKSVACASPLMIGEFRHQNGDRYAMIVNLSLEKSAHFTTGPAEPRKISVVAPMDGSVSPYSGDGLWLTAGQGVLLKFSSNK